MSSAGSKRISKRSAIPGFSQRQWGGFVKSLTVDECYWLYPPCGSKRVANPLDPHYISLCAKILKILRKDEVARGIYELHMARKIVPSNKAVPAPLLVGVETNPGPAVGFVPAPRLVGVELNPGPNPVFLGALGAGALGLGKAAIKAARKKAVATIKKKLVSKVKKAASSTLSTSSMVSSKKVPGMFTTAVSRTVSNKSNTHRINFDTIGVPVWTDGSNASFRFGSNTGPYNLNMDPNHVLPGNSKIFGEAVAQMANLYRRYRVTSLRAEWRPCVNTAQSGSFIIGVTTENVTEVNPISASNVSSLPHVTLIQACLPTTINCSSINKEWLWTQDPTTTTTASNRQTELGTVIMVTQNLGPGASNLMGYLSFSGTIEFAELGVVMSLAVSSSSSQSSTAPAVVQNSYLSSIEEESVNVCSKCSHSD